MHNQQNISYQNENKPTFSLQTKKSFSLIGRGKTLDTYNQRIYSKIQKDYVDSLEEMRHLKEKKIIKVDLDQMPIQKIQQELDINIPIYQQQHEDQPLTKDRKAKTLQKNQLDIPQLLQKTLPLRQKRCKTNDNSPNNRSINTPKQFKQMYRNFDKYKFKQEYTKTESFQEQNEILAKNNLTSYQIHEKQDFLKENTALIQQREEINSRQTITPIQPVRVFVTEKGKLINDRFDTPIKKPVSFAESIKKQNADISLIEYFQVGKDKVIEHLDYQDMTDNNLTNFKSDNKQHIQNIIDKHQKHMKPQCCSKGEQLRADSALRNYRNQLDEEIDKFYKNLEQKSLIPTNKYQKDIKRAIPYKDGLNDEYFFQEEDNNQHTNQSYNYQSKYNQNNDKGADFFKKYIQDVDLEKYKELPQWIKVQTDKQDLFPKIQSPSIVGKYIQNGVLPIKSVLDKSEQSIHQKKKKYIRKIEKIVTECDDYKQSNY